MHPIRAVLIETPDEARGRRLMELVNHPLVCGPGKRAGLFWFTISPLFTAPQVLAGNGAPLPGYLLKPEIVLGPIFGRCQTAACTPWLTRKTARAIRKEAEESSLDSVSQGAMLPCVEPDFPTSCPLISML